METEDIITWIESLAPILSANNLTDEQLSKVRESLERLEAADPLTEDHAKRLYSSIRCRLRGVEQTLFRVIEKVPQSPFRWQLWDDDDEGERDLFIQEMKEYALEAADLPIEPLYNLNRDPLRWFQDALQIELNSYELYKMFVYAVGNIGGTAILAPKELHTAEGERLLIQARDKVKAFEPRSQGIEERKLTTLRILDDKIARLEY